MSNITINGNVTNSNLIGKIDRPLDALDFPDSVSSAAQRLAKKANIAITKELAKLMVRKNDFDATNYDIIKWNLTDQSQGRFDVCFKVLYKKDPYYKTELKLIQEEIRSQNKIGG